MNLAYFGLPLGALLLAQDGHELSLAVLSPIEAPGRRRLIAKLGADRVIEAVRLGSGLDEAVDVRLAALSPDLVVSWFWTRRLPRRWLQASRCGAIGVHPSLLPRHRGPNPFFAAVDAGDSLTGVSVHELDEQYDTGNVLLQQTVPVADRDAWQLARALDRPGLAALRLVVTRFARGEQPRGMRQDELEATWAPEPEGQLLRVDWRWSTERVLRRIRALSPVPGLAIELGGQPIFVTRARAGEHFVAALEPGEAAAQRGSAVIRTGDGAIEILRAVTGEGGPLPAGRTLEAADLVVIVDRSHPGVD
jgi:methionyl-tRNA formyltransferase